MVYILWIFIINLRSTEYYLNNSNNNALNPFSYNDYTLESTKMISADYPIYSIISMMFTLYYFSFTPHNLIYIYFVRLTKSSLKSKHLYTNTWNKKSPNDYYSLLLYEYDMYTINTLSWDKLKMIHHIWNFTWKPFNRLLG